MKKPWQQSEQRALEDFAAFDPVKVPLSGAGPVDKLDVMLTSGKLAGYLISNKHTSKESVTFKKADLQKDKNQAKFMGCKLFRRVELENTTTGKMEKIIEIDQDLFLELLSDG